jgi:nucleotide-binding universal stress UspA family protein
MNSPSMAVLMKWRGVVLSRPTSKERVWPIHGEAQVADQLILAQMENTNTTSEKQSQQAKGLPIKQIVVAVDLSARSEKTVAYAIEIARTFGARIHLVYVQAPESITEYATKGGNENLEVKRHDPVRDLTDLNKRTRRIYPNCGADLRVGACADEISQLARTLDADLIITASHHPSFLARLLNVDQAPKIMHRAPCPVLIYHDQKQ